MERTGKKKEKKSRTAKFEVCSIEISNLVAIQISEMLRGFVWGKAWLALLPYNSFKFSDLKMLPFPEYITQYAETLQDY